jgi:hypothetical protein
MTTRLAAEKLGSRKGSGLTSLHGLHGIFDLEDVPIGAKGAVSLSKKLEHCKINLYLNTRMS